MHWIQTISGKKIDFLDPDPTQIDIEDIATSLSRIWHYNGHLTHRVSVAEHSVLVSEKAAEEAYEGWHTSSTLSRTEYVCQAALWGLLHDASEAYTGDIPGPLKRLLEASGLTLLGRIEAGLNAVIREAFVTTEFIGLGPLSFVKGVDRRMLITEHMRFQGEEPTPWSWSERPYSEEEVTFHHWDEEDARKAFMDRFNLLTEIAYEISLTPHITTLAS